MMLKSSNDDFMRMLPHQFSQKNWQNPERICNGVMGGAARHCLSQFSDKKGNKGLNGFVSKGDCGGETMLDGLVYGFILT